MPAPSMHPVLYDIEIDSHAGLEFEYNGKPKFITTLNVNVLLQSQQDPKFREAIQRSNVTIDGQWIMWAVRRKYGKKFQLTKVSGSDFIYELPDIARKHEKRIFLLGASEENNKKAVENLRAHSGYEEIDGFSPPWSGYPFSEEFLDATRESLREARPNFLVLALGVPKQEYWALENYSLLEELKIDYVLFLGAAVDFVSGNLPRAPRLMQKLGLESVYRVYRDRKKLKTTLSWLPIIPKIIFNKI